MRRVSAFAILTLFWCTASIAQTSPKFSPDDDRSSVNPPPYSLPDPQQQQQVEQNLKDIHFDFDRYNVRPEDRQTLEQAANWLKANPNSFVTIAGDADERGDITYNLALSQKRAEAAHDALVSMGVPESQIVFATGWGKLYPTCNQSDESCWSQNRRAHFDLW